MYFNPYAFSNHEFIVMATKDEKEFAVFDDDKGDILTCSDYSIKVEHYELVYDKLIIVGPESGIPPPIIISCFESWLASQGYFGELDELAQRPLPPGSVIKYQSFEATVIEDLGGPTITVNHDGEKEEWMWKTNDAECEVISIPSNKPQKKHLDIH